MMSLEGVQLIPPRLPIEMPVSRKTRIQLLFLGRSTGRSTGVSGLRPTRRGRVCAPRGAALNNSRERTRDVVVNLFTESMSSLKPMFAEQTLDGRSNISLFGTT